MPTLSKVGSSSNESGVPNNLILAAGISLISQLVSELQVLPVLRPPYCNLRHTVTLSSLVSDFPVSMFYKTIVAVTVT